MNISYIPSEMGGDPLSNIASPPRLEETERKIMIKRYQFDVPCTYYYEVNAESEEEARKILIEKGGIDIDGDLLLEQGDYEQAKLVGILE